MFRGTPARPRRAAGREVVHDRADERPLPLMPREGFDLGVDVGNPRRRVDGAVQRIRMRQRADHRQPVHDPGDPRQVVADLDARHVRRDRLQFPLNLGRGLGLGVEGLMLRGRAVLVDQDARAGATEPGALCRRARPGASQAQIISQRESERSQPPDVEEVAAAQSMAEPLGVPEESQHGIVTRSYAPSRNWIETPVRGCIPRSRIAATPCCYRLSPGR